MESDTHPLRSSIRRDFEFNKRLQDTLTKYWKLLGYTIKFTMSFNDKMNVYEIRSKDFVNGLPKKGLTSLARNRLIL